MAVSDLRSLKNIGTAMEKDLHRLGIHTRTELAERNPDELYLELWRMDGMRHDPCVLDTLRAAVDEAGGGPPADWWLYTAKRKAGELPPVPVL
jgi:hypothetical protein